MIYLKLFTKVTNFYKFKQTKKKQERRDAFVLALNVIVICSIVQINTFTLALHNTCVCKYIYAIDVHRLQNIIFYCT